MLEKIHKFSRKIGLPFNIFLSILIMVIQFGPGDINMNVVNFTIFFLVAYWILFVVFMLILFIRSQLEHSKIERLFLSLFYLMFLSLPLIYVSLIAVIADYLK